MKIILYISIVLTLQVSAQSLTEILESLQTSSTYKSLLEKASAQKAEQELIVTDEAMQLGATLSHADNISAGEKDGLEYSLGISQELLNPFASSSKNRGLQEASNAITKEVKHSLHLLRLDVVKAYHSVCISKEMKEKSFILYNEQAKGYAQFKRAYELGEISKKDLLFNKLDLVKIKQNVNAYERVYIEALASLQVLVDNKSIKNVSCEDIKEPTKELSFEPLLEHTQLKAIEHKENAAKAFYGVHNTAISSLGYEFLYEKELETKRYSVGVSIPLDSLSEQKEKHKVQNLALASAYAYEKEALRAQVTNYSKSAVEKLGVLYDEFTLLKEEVLPLNKELISLSKAALLEGEGDIMEYLDSTRSYSLNLIEMLEIKKVYYDELFELYKVADIEYGEKICKK